MSTEEGWSGADMSTVTVPQLLHPDGRVTLGRAIHCGRCGEFMGVVWGRPSPDILVNKWWWRIIGCPHGPGADY